MDGSTQQMSTLVGGSDKCRSITLQNPTGNAAVAYGDSAEQAMSLVAEASVSLPVTSLKNLWINGTNTEILNVLVYG